MKRIRKYGKNKKIREGEANYEKLENREFKKILW